MVYSIQHLFHLVCRAAQSSSHESGNYGNQGDDETTDANESAVAELIMPGGSKKRTYLELEEVYA